MTMLWWVRGCAVAALLSTAAFAAFLAHESAEQRRWSGRVTHEVHRYSLSQRSLQRDLLNARIGIVRSYDSINRHLDNAGDSLAKLSVLSGAPANRAHIEDARGRIRRLEQLVERFKTNNALLQNALASFAMSATGPRVGGTRGDEQRLASAILRLTLDTSPEAIRAAQRAIRGLPVPPPHPARANGMRVNAALLLTVLPAVDRELRLLRAFRLDESSDRLRMVLDAEAEARRLGVGRAETALIVSGIVTVALFALWLVMMRVNNRHLQRVADNEHLSATVANLLIDARLFDGKRPMMQVLAQLAERMGADSAWVGISPPDGEPWSVCWPDASPENRAYFLRCARLAYASGGWRRGALRLCRQDPAQARLAATACSKDMADMLFIRGGDDSCCAMLIFAAAHQPLNAASDIIMGMNAALAAVRQAFERQMLAEERLELERKLAHSRRLETMGAVATGVAHNFNNILGAIGGFSEIAQIHTRPGSAIRRSLDEIQLAVDRAARLVEEILDFGRPHSGERTPVDPIVLVGEALHMFDASGALAPVTLDIVSAPARIVGNGDQLQQVLFNILNNAAQASSDRSLALELRAERIARPTEFSHGSLPPGHYAVMAIRDQGPGVSQRHKPRLFEPFFTTRAAGTGLGLSTAWEVVTDHGGTIDVADGLAGGSVFSIWLPAVRGGAPPNMGRRG